MSIAAAMQTTILLIIIKALCLNLHSAFVRGCDLHLLLVVIPQWNSARIKVISLWSGFSCC